MWLCLSVVYMCMVNCWIGYEYGYESCLCLWIWILLWNMNVYVNKCLWLCTFECFHYIIFMSYAFEVEWSDWVLEPSVETMRTDRPEQNSWAGMGSKYCDSMSEPWDPSIVGLRSRSVDSIRSRMIYVILVVVLETCRKLEVGRLGRVLRKKTVWFEVEASSRSD